MHLDILAGPFIEVIAFINAVLVPVILAIAFITFMFGIYRYFIAGGASPEQRESGQRFAIGGIVGFVIIFSLWGIINLLIGTLGFNSNVRPPLPTFGAPTTQTTQTNPFNTNNAPASSNTSSGATGGEGQPCNGDFSCSSSDLSCDINSGRCVSDITGENGTFSP